MAPAQARAAVRAAVTAARPVVLPTAIAPDWRTEVTTGRDGFVVRYEDPADPARTVTVAVAGTDNLGAAALTYPAFHGDQRSLYSVVGRSRILSWHEPGEYDHAAPAYPGVPYQLTATGLTDAEFWRVADSIRRHFCARSPVSLPR